MPRGIRVVLSVIAAALAAGAVGIAAPPALAHGFSSVVYADIGSEAIGEVTATLQLEYDLLVVSAADAEKQDALFQAGTAAFESGDDAERAAVIEAHMDPVLAYVSERFTVATSDGEACTVQAPDSVGMTTQDGAPYAVMTLRFSCSESANAHVVASTLFPDDEGYVTGTKTILTYSLDMREGSAVLDANQSSFSTEQSLGERFWEFFRLGGEHLLGGLDHILFLLALIAGSRRLREIVLAATSFTLAHSVTFILAATHVISVPASFVEPVIALSISIVAGWYLWVLWRKGPDSVIHVPTGGVFGIDRAGWIRFGVVFVFGLVHGLGFAGALGINEAWSWTLLWSLLIFNLGIEAVQIGIIVIVFPLLTLLRHRAPRVAIWATALLTAGVTAVGLYWFVERLIAG